MDGLRRWRWQLRQQLVRGVVCRLDRDQVSYKHAYTDCTLTCTSLCNNASTYIDTYKDIQHACIRTHRDTYQDKCISMCSSRIFLPTHIQTHIKTHSMHAYEHMIQTHSEIDTQHACIRIRKKQLPRGLTLAKALNTFQKRQQDTPQAKSKTEKLKTLQKSRIFFSCNKCVKYECGKKH